MGSIISMIDYGGSNMRSAQKAFEHVGATVQIADCPEAILGAEKLVLPGVGAFAAGMNGLRARKLDDAIRTAVAQGTPLLGICLGMQLLFDESEEMGRTAGLGLLPGTVVRFPANGLKVPHIGWNQIEHRMNHPLLAGVPSGAHAYFVHSYYCAPADPTHVIAQAEYGEPFTAIVGRDHLFGIQFHPEKSHAVGLTIIDNYVRMQ